MPVKFVMSLWRERKISHATCITDLLLCREPASLRLVELIQGYEAQELADSIRRRSQAAIEEVFARHARFRRHAVVHAFLQHDVSPSPSLIDYHSWLRRVSFSNPLLVLLPP